MIDENEIRSYPMDFDALEKGHSWTPAQLEELTQQIRGTDAYRFALMSLQKRITRECHDRGKDFQLAVVRGNLRILKDGESSIYNAGFSKRRLKQSAKSYRNMIRTVNVANLTPQEAKDHERNIMVLGRQLAAAKAAKKQALTIDVHQRTVPGLPVRQSGQVTNEGNPSNEAPPVVPLDPGPDGVV